jgi:hypothetical protein
VLGVRPSSPPTTPFTRLDVVRNTAGNRVVAHGNPTTREHSSPSKFLRSMLDVLALH